MISSLFFAAERRSVLAHVPFLGGGGLRLGSMFQGRRSIQSHELSAFVVAPISDRIAQAFSESHQPCERVRVCFCESQLDINHFTRRGASHAAHPPPSKTLERKKNPPLTARPRRFRFPPSGSFI